MSSFDLVRGNHCNTLSFLVINMLQYISMSKTSYAPVLLVSKPPHLVLKFFHLFLQLFKASLDGSEVTDLCNKGLVSYVCQHVVNMLTILVLRVEDAQLVREEYCGVLLMS